MLGFANMAPNGACGSFAQVTDTSTTDPTHTAEQAETSLATFDRPDGERGGVVAFNDDTGNPGKYVFYGTVADGSRHVLSGYSAMGWAYSTSNGTNWTYGGKITPSADWPILWSDSGVTSNTFGNGALKGYVWMTMLAVSKTKYPPGGIDGGLEGNVSGACIAKSSDSGVHFALSQCVTNAFDFYDGANMVADATGLVCAAYNDYTLKQIDVWCAHGILDTFHKTTTQPFPGLRMVGHPRMRADDNGHIYLVAPVNGRQLAGSIYNGSTWSPFKPISPPDLSNEPTVQTNPNVRTGPQYSFDIGHASSLGNDDIRLVYTTQGSDGRFHMTGVGCDLGLNCWAQPGWGTDTSIRGSQFNPKLRKSPQIFNANGDLVSDEEWKVALYTEDGTRSNQVAIHEGNLITVGSTRAFFNDELIQPHAVCPDGRGYWGDYDEVQFMRGDVTTEFIPSFIVTGTDSTDGACVSSTYTATPMHISEVIWK
jgi:hypothetical protein